RTGAEDQPGLETARDALTLAAHTAPGLRPALLGHPQYGLVKFLHRLGMVPSDVEELGAPLPSLRLRGQVLREAMRPAETTELWTETRQAIADGEVAEAVEHVTLVEAANEREEAVAIAAALCI